MLVSRLADQRPAPWKNGGGTTLELFALPRGATLETFSLRLSRARVERAGPFSRFPGVDRSLVLLAGEGLQLRFGPSGGVGDGAAGEELRLATRAAPLVFAGERAVEATLLGGAVEDLNVMTRRSELRHELAWLQVRGRAQLARRGRHLALVVVEGRLAVDGVSLVAGEAVMSAGATDEEGDLGRALELDAAGEGALALRLDVFAATS